MKELEKLYSDIQPKIYKFFYLKTFDKELSEDLTQEVFYEAIKSSNSFKGKSTLKTWVFSIAINVLRKQFRKNKYNKNLIDKLSVDSINIETLEEMAIAKEEKLKLLSLVDRLDEVTQEIFSLRVYGELSFKEIGDLIGKSENYTRVIFHRTKLRLYNLVKEDGENSKN